MSGGGVLRRWLKVADPTALTARETLQRGLAYGRRIADIRRSDLLAFDWRAEGGAARRALEELARGTNLLLNPNKHHFEIALDEEPIRPRGNAWILVHEPGEGGALGESIRRRGLLPFPLQGTRRGVLWELDIEGEPEEIRRLAAEIAVARERRVGLLANPEYQAAEVLETPPQARRVLELLAAMGAPVAHDGN